MNQIIALKVMGRIVLVAFVFCVGKSTFAQQSMSSSNFKAKQNNSVRKGPLVVVGSSSMNHTANADKYNSHGTAQISEDEKMGIQYYPLAGVDTGSARLQERKFKWRAYYHLRTEVVSRNVLDYASHLHAIAAVGGTGFPTKFVSQSGYKDSDITLSLGPVSFVVQHFDADPNPKNYSDEIIHTKSEQTPISESGPVVESLYYWISGGYATADVDAGLFSDLRAQATFQYNALSVSDPKQYSVKEAFYYPYSTR